MGYLAGSVLPGMGKYAYPPPNSADGVPEWIGFSLTVAALLVALWLWRIKPANGRQRGRR